MKKRTFLIWLFVIVVMVFCITKVVGVGEKEVAIETETVDVPNVVIDGGEPPVIKVNVITKDEEKVTEKENIPEIDKTLPKFSLEIGEASYDIYSNDLTRIPSDAGGEYFYYQFANGNEITVYLQEKGDILPMAETEANYADKDFCEENNIKVFDKQKIGDSIMYLISYSDFETPDVIEVWRENEKSVLNVYYVDYEQAIDEAMVESIKDFVNHIIDTTAKG